MAKRQPTVAGTNEIATYFGVYKQLAYKWTQRSDFPAPIAGPDHPDNPLSMGSLWSFADIVKWGRKHGREPGAGPREPSGFHRPAQTFKARELRVVPDRTNGGYAVEHDGRVVAGPYAAKPDAQEAKRALVEGRLVRAAG